MKLWRNIFKKFCLDFSSSMALQLQPALPSFMIFMAIRYEDHVEHEEQLTKMFSTAFNCIEETTKVWKNIFRAYFRREGP